MSAHVDFEEGRPVIAVESRAVEVPTEVAEIVKEMQRQIGEVVRQGVEALGPMGALLRVVEVRGIDCSTHDGPAAVVVGPVRVELVLLSPEDPPA